MLVNKQESSDNHIYDCFRAALAEARLMTPKQASDQSHFRLLAEELRSIERNIASLEHNQQIVHQQYGPQHDTGPNDWQWMHEKCLPQANHWQPENRETRAPNQLCLKLIPERKSPLAAMIVMKFGGTSVEDAQAISRLVNLVRERLREQPVIVTSALAGVTDALLHAHLQRLAATNRQR
jgi:hypothetical protein